MLYHHSYYGVSPLPLPNVISFTTTISTTSASLYHSCILDHCFFGLPLFVWTTTTLWIATIFLDYRCIYVSNKAVCDPNFRFFISVTARFLDCVFGILKTKCVSKTREKTLSDGFKQISVRQFV